MHRGGARTTGSRDVAITCTGWTLTRMISLDLLVNAVVAGLLLGGFYAAVTSAYRFFGMLDIVNIAHPAFIILGSYVAYIVNTTFGIDPISPASSWLPAFSARDGHLSDLLCRLRAARQIIRARLLRPPVCRRGRPDPGLRGRLPFVEAAYIGPSLHFGFVDLPLRMLIPCLVSLLMLAVLQLFFARTSSAAPSWRYRRTGWPCS